MRKKNFNLKLSTLFAVLCCTLFSTTSMAQTTPAQCNSGCTSNDVQIVGAYLSDINGVQLTNYVCGSGVPVYLTLQLTTNTPRMGVSIYSEIQTVVNGVATGTSVGIVSQCFGTALNTTGSIVTFQNPITWNPCGSQIALVGTYTAWGTGNKNFCTGTAFQCGGTPSKCHAAQAGEIIIIQIPTPGTASSEKCSETAGSYLAHFNLTTLETAIKNGANVTVAWFEDAAWTTSITTASNYEVTSSSHDVHAKVCDAVNTSACADAVVTLTVYEKPSVQFTITQPTASLCSATGTGAINFCNTITGFTYKVGSETAINGNGSAQSVTGLAAGSNPSIIVKNTNTGGITAGCSNTFACTDAVGSCSSATNRASVTSENITQNQTTVKAYPNPFSDKINFVVTTSVAGQGNLEVFNFMGQKIKTVYTGFIPAGTQTFELNLPAKQISNLVYVLRIGNNKTTGKLLQLNR